MSRLQYLTHNHNGSQRGTVKTLTFAVMHFTVAFAVTFALTGDIVIGGLVAAVEPAVNTVAYHFHEKVWLRLAPGHRSSLPGSRAEEVSEAGSEPRDGILC